MKTVEQAPTSPEQGVEYIGARAYSGVYQPTEGQSTMKNILDSARSGTMEQLEWDQIVNTYWHSKPYIEKDPTGPLSLVDALSNITPPENTQEKNDLDEMFLDAFDDIAHHPKSVTYKSLITGMLAIDKIESVEHKLQALTVIEGVLGTLREMETADKDHGIKVDPVLRDTAARGLRDYRANLEHGQPGSLEELVIKPVQQQTEQSIADHSAKAIAAMDARTEDDTQENPSTADLRREIVPKITRQDMEDLYDAHLFAKRQDKQRRSEWDAYYENGGSPVEDVDGVMNSTANEAVPSDEEDPESTGALMRRQLQQLEATGNENISRRLLQSRTGRVLASRAVSETTEVIKRAS